MSTFTDEQSGLFWDPFASQWEQLGFTGAEEVYETYGKLFPGYSPKQENALYEQVTAKNIGELAAYNLMVSNEDARITLNTENRQTMSELGLDSLYRGQETNAQLNSLKKDAVTKAAIDSLDEAKSISGRSGLTSGSAMTSMDMAIDTVKSKINAANSSQSFSRKKTKLAVDNLKANVGYLDPNGNWVQGSQGELEELKSGINLGTSKLKMENRQDIRDYTTEMKVGDMYEAWQQDILQSVGTLFSQDVRGSQAKACSDAGGIWDVSSMTCTELPEGASVAENWDTLEEGYIDPNDPSQEDMTDCNSVEYDPATGIATCLDGGSVENENIPWNPTCEEGTWSDFNNCCVDWSGGCI